MTAKAEALSIRLPLKVRKQVDDYAKATRKSRAAIVKDAVEIYMRGNEAYVREIDAAVASAESGRGHSSRQIFAWMRSWGTAAELPSPKPDLRRRK